MYDSDFDAGNGRGMNYETLASLIDAAAMTKSMFSLRIQSLIEVGRDNGLPSKFIKTWCPG